MGRRKNEIPKTHATRDTVIALLKAGAIITVALTAPGAIRVLKAFIVDDQKAYYASSLSRNLTDLLRKGVVEIKETSEGTIVILNEKGTREILKFDLDQYTIPKQHPWDKKWRMVFFDIDKRHNSIRNVFPEYLKTLGFFPMQKSVYVYPYPCRKIIQYLREYYQIPHGVKYAVIESIENDEDLKAIFQLS